MGGGFWVFGGKFGLGGGDGERKGTNVFPCVAEVGLGLFPEEIDMEVFHQRGELVRDVLERLRARLQRREQLAVGIDGFPRRDGMQHALRGAGQLGDVAAVVRRAEEEDGVGGDEDRVEVRDVRGGSAGGVAEGLRDEDKCCLLATFGFRAASILFGTFLTMIPPNEWQMKMIGRSDAPSI